MTVHEFRRLALGFPGASESAHMNHPDFRAGGRIFASLGYPDDDWGMVKLTPAQQKACLSEHPAVFGSCKGAWGKSGATSVHLASAGKTAVRAALEAAWRNVTAQAKRKS